ncbi:uncharacterized protein [Atheta coriaria]|uniref:uncharacterized protein n=1 Tax=Dalotia coriaria TaxID=877792 RepID=UPI0031F33F1F
MITRKFSIDDNPDAFLEMVLGLKTENMCVYAFCLLRLIQSMPAINTWIRKILDRLAILYYINAKAYTAVLDESLKRLSPTDANNFLSRLRLVNEQNLKMKVDATKQPIDMILRELLCGNRAIGNPEHLLRFEERTVLTCNEIISAWKTWSSTNPKIKIKTNVLAKSDPTKMVVKPANKSPIAQWQYRAPQKQKKQAGTRVNPDQNTPSSQSRQNPIQGLRTMRHSYQPAQNSQNYPRQYNSGVQQYMSSYTQSPGYSSGDYQCPVSINSSQQNANQWNSSMPLAANSLPPRTIVNQQIMPPVTGYTSRAPSHWGVVHYSGGHAQNPSLPYMPMASIRPTQGYNRDDVYCHTRQYPQIAPMPAPHFVPTYRQEADRSGTLTQATPHAKSLVLIQGLNVNPEPVGSVQRQHTPTTICAPRYIPKQIVYSSQSINRNNQPQMCAPQLTTVTTADPSPTTQPCMIRDLIASTYANSRQPNENVPLALPVPLTAAWYSNNSYQQRENMPLVQQVPLPTPTYIDNSYRQRDSVPSTQVESAQPVISLVAGTADKDVEPATSTTVNVSTPSSSETLTQSAEFYINRLASCIEQMSKQGITLPVDLQKKVASLKDRQPCEEPDFDSTHLGIIAKAFQAMVPVMENITNLSLNAVKPMKEAIEVIEIDDDDEVKVEVTETTVNIGDCQSQTLDEIQFPPNPYELTEPVGSELTESNDCDDIEYQCICGKKAHVRCRCNAAIYCSEECRLAQIEEHRPTCMLNLGGTSLYKLLGPR